PTCCIDSTSELESPPPVRTREGASGVGFEFASARRPDLHGGRATVVPPYQHPRALPPAGPVLAEQPLLRPAHQSDPTYRLSVRPCVPQRSALMAPEPRVHRQPAGQPRIASIRAGNPPEPISALTSDLPTAGPRGGRLSWPTGSSGPTAARSRRRRLECASACESPLPVSPWSCLLFRGLLRTGRWTQLSWGGATLLSSHAGRFSVSGGRHINQSATTLGRAPLI